MPEENNSLKHHTASTGPVTFQQPVHADSLRSEVGPYTASIDAHEPQQKYDAGQGNVIVSHPDLRARAVKTFEFDGGAGSYLGVGILAFLVTVCTLGFATPWATCMLYRWKTEHTLIEGRRLRFTGNGAELFGMWIVWFLLMIVTVGIYSFWVQPRVTKWCVEHQEF